VHSRGRRLARFPADREPLLLDVCDQQVESPVDDAGQVSIRNTVPEQVLRHSQLVVKLLICGELYPVRLLGERRDRAPVLFARRWPYGRRIEGERKRLHWSVAFRELPDPGRNWRLRR
jgi:hypothetical protein